MADDVPSFHARSVLAKRIRLFAAHRKREGLMPDSLSLFDRLVGFPTVSRDSNLGLIGFVRDLLTEAGAAPRLIANAEGSKANLFATIGPADQPGVILSGHTDVVPVDGQVWSSDPFILRDAGGRLYGRGAADMKGFLACALHAALAAAERSLARPLHLAFSYDEEVGCLGVRDMLPIISTIAPPICCIVGEPTSMKLATGHKGKVFAHATCRGRSAHTAFAPEAVNAIHLACDLVSELRALQDRLRESGARDADYNIPYTTVHAGRIRGGEALNIVPDRCDLDFEIRHLAADDPNELMREIGGKAEAIAARYRDKAPEAGIAIDVVNDYPGLDTPGDADVVAFVKSMTGENDTIKVAFGTEGGLFRERVHVPTVICGPGSMEQGHKPDEFVTKDQLARCDAMMEKLVRRLM
jgi:acetylornithine deacetylase